MEGGKFVMSYELEIENAAVDRSSIPEYASVSEAVIYTLEANEVNFNEMMKNIGLLELGYYEANGEMVEYTTEAFGKKKEDAKEEKSEKDEAKEAKKAEFKAKLSATGEKVKKAIISFLKTAWEKIKGLFETILRKINELVTAAIKKIGIKHLKVETLKSGLVNLKKKNRDSFESYKYDKLIAFLGGGDLKSDIGSAIAQGKATANPDNYTKGLINTVDEKIKAIKNKIFDKSDAENEKITVEAIKKYFRGEKTNEVPGDEDLKKIIDIVKEKKYNENLKKAFASCKESFNEMIKFANKNANIDSGKVKVFHEIVNLCTSIYGAAFAEYYNVVRTNVMIATRTALASNVNALKNAANPDNDSLAALLKGVDTGKGVDVDAKGSDSEAKLLKGVDKKKKATKESVEDITAESTTYTEEIESLFDWKF